MAERNNSGMRIRIRGGLDIALPGAPVQAIREGGGEVGSVALLGADYSDVRPSMRVDVGDRVSAGQTLFVDHRRPAIAFTAPAGGTIAAIHRGLRRALNALVIDQIAGPSDADARPPVAPAQGTKRQLLLSSGLWPAFRTRPFGRIPDPVSEPAAVFVTAMDTNPLAADPAVVIARFAEHFRQGVEALTELTPGQVLLCQAPGPPLVDAEDHRIACVQFEGPHPSGLAGTHIHKLLPVGNGKSVWHIGYQDVIAIGHLLATGAPWPDRIVALAGEGVREPRLVRTRLGASLDDLVAGKLNNGRFRVLSGSPLRGRASGYLGRYHTQVSVLAEPEPVSPPPLLSRFFGAGAGRSMPLIPHAALERAATIDIPVVPLLRALSVKDAQTAELLGCLELVEEDVALLSYLCASGTDYGRLLRAVLDDLEEAE